MLFLNHVRHIRHKCFWILEAFKVRIKIEDIQADYKDRIYLVRHDQSISKSERKEMIRQLKSDRELAIHDAERNYYKSYDNSSRVSSVR